MHQPGFINVARELAYRPQTAKGDVHDEFGAPSRSSNAGPEQKGLSILRWISMVEIAFGGFRILETIDRSQEQNRVALDLLSVWKVPHAVI